MVVAESKHQVDAPLQAVDNLNSFAQVFCPVNDRLAQNLRALFDAFAVANPPNEGEVGGDWVAILKPLSRSRHPGVIYEGESNATPPEN